MDLNEYYQREIERLSGEPEPEATEEKYTSPLELDRAPYDPISLAYKALKYPTDVALDAASGVLKYFSYPFYGAYGALGSLWDPKETAGKAFWKGFTGKEQKGVGEVLDKIKPKWDKPLEDTYGKTVTGYIRGAMDVVAPDPLIGVGKLGKIPKVAKVAGKAHDVVSGSNLGRNFFRKAGGSYSKADEIIDEMRYGTKWAEEQLNKQMGELSEFLEKNYADMLEYGDFDDLRHLHREIIRAIERPNAPESIHYKAITKEFDKSLAVNRAVAIENDALRKGLGLETHGIITEPEYRRFPRIESKAAKYKESPKAIPPTVSQWFSGAWEKAPKGRNIFKFVNDKGEPIIRNGQELVGKVADKRTGVMKTKDGRHFMRDTGAEVFLRQADIIEAQRVSGGKFIDDPITAFAMDFRRKLRENSYLKFLHQMRKHPEWWLENPDVVPKGWRSLNVPGLDHVHMPKPLANRMDNVGRIMMDPDTYLGSVEAVLRGFFKNTKMGMVMERGRKSWARSVTGPILAFHTRNFSSQQWQAIIEGVPAHRLLPLAEEALKVEFNYGKRVIPEIANDKLFERLAKEGGVNTSWSLAEMGSRMDEPFRVSGRIPYVSPVLGAHLWGKKATSSTVFPAFERATDWSFKIGNYVENNTKIVVAIHNIRKAMKQGKSLDEAISIGAKRAREYLYDYGDLNPVEQLFKNISPFYNWHKNLISRTLRDLGVQPQRYGRIGRALDTILKPIPQEHMDLMEGWVESGVPVTDVGPINLGKSKEGRPLTFLSHSYMPFQTLNELFQWPPRIGGMIGPGIKVPAEGIFNYDTFRDRPIEKSGSYLKGLFAPFTGPDWTPREELFGIPISAAQSHAFNMIPGQRMIRQLDQIYETFGKKDPRRPQFTPLELVGRLLTGSTFYEHRPEWAYKSQDKKLQLKIKDWKNEYWKARRAKDVAGMKRIAGIIRNLNRQRKELKRKLQIGNHKLGTMSYP